LAKLLHSKKDAGLKVSVGAPRKLVAGYGKRWLEMSDDHKHFWCERALQEQKDGQRQLANDLRAAMVRKASLEQECMMVGHDSPLKLSACRFTKQELHAFDAMWDDPELSNTRVNELLADICRPLEPLSADEHRQLSEFPVPGNATSTCKPAWSSVVAKRRYSFEDCVLKITYEEGLQSFVRFLWALQSLIVVSFLELEPARLAGAAASSTDDVVVVGMDPRWKHMFKDLATMYSWSTDDEYDAKVDVQVLTKVFFLGGGVLASASDWVSLDAFLESLPPLPGPLPSDRPPRPRPVPASVLDLEVVKQHPWLLDIASSSSQKVGGQAALAEGSCESDQDVKEGKSDFEESQESDDAQAHDVDALLEALEKKRLLEGRAGKDRPFHWKVMGGKWLAETRGLSHDAFRATWKTAEGRAFLFTYSFNQSASFTIAKFGEDLARACAEYWVCTMEHLYQLAEKAGPKHEFCEAELRAFEEPVAFSLAFPLASAEQQKRMQELRSLSPAKPR
jgi:hypothetical protein